MSLKFITGNVDKFEEVKSILGIPLEQCDFDLPEIQELDATLIIRQKLAAAEEQEQGEYIVEDTSLYFDCLGGKLPGPLIKWFLRGLENDGMAELVEKYGERGAEARTLVGYANNRGVVKFFAGTQRGIIVRPRGNNDFGWGPIFQPEGSDKTFGEMERAEKHAVSMRGTALQKFKDFFELQNV